ncbi:MAG TPA: extracellular solute-binding protein, partial [Firmicutes bacterium]|nr:extracellular solute-binding protein [Bacillota bacterium]
WNWETFLTYCKRVSRDINGDGINDIWGVRSNAHISYALPWLHNAGGGWFDRNVDPTQSALTQPASITALRYYTELFSLHKVALHNVSFGDGKAAFQMDQGPFFVQTLHDSNMNWGMWKRPMGPVNDGSVLLGTGFSIAKNSKHPELAWEWIKFVGTRQENVKRMYEITNRTPALVSALPSYTQYMRQQYGNAAAPIMEITANVSNFTGVISPKLDELTPLIQTTLRDIQSGKAPLESTLVELERQVNLILKQ